MIVNDLLRYESDLSELDCKDWNSGVSTKLELVIVDFHAEATMGPPKEHRLPVDDVVAEAKASGLVKRSEARLPQLYVLVLTAQ